MNGSSDTPAVLDPQPTPRSPAKTPTKHGLVPPAQASPFDIADPLPTGTVLLEASAGTGKTWTIAALVTRYVAEGVVRLPEMLVVTFGRAASQELRARVREALVAAERALAEPDAPHTVAALVRDEMLQLLLAADDDERTRRLLRVRDALTGFDAATIATTHQFCQQVLRSLGVAGTTDASAQLVEDLDDLLVEVVDDLYLRGFMGEEQDPFFTRTQALAIARTAVDDIHARLRPQDTATAPGSTPARRVRFAQAVRAEMHLRKERLQVMHYNDLLTRLRDALADERSPARARMRRRWKVVLVDEFQDTDPVQWQVLDRAFSGHAQAMVLIGDPKQAVYAFRGGDIATYLEAAATAGDRRTLPRNYRSDGPLVQALDALLRGARLGDEQIAVLPVTPCRPDSRLRGAPSDAPLRVRQVLRRDHLSGDAKMGRVRAWITRDLALDIARLLSAPARFGERALLARDVAVLAHKTRDLLDAQRALREVGIHAVTTGGTGVLRSAAAHEWLAVLEAMAAPHRSMLTRAAALTDLLGYDVAVLGARGPGEAERLDDELAYRCRELADVYARHGMAAVVEVLSAAGLAGRVLGQIGGQRTLTDLRHVAELLHEVDTPTRIGLATLLDWLRAAMADDAPQTSGARSRRLDSDSAAVQLVTIHSAKGLQYPVVYLPSLTDRWVSDNPELPLYHDDPPGRTRCLDVGGPEGPHRAAAVARHKEEDAGESLRLLYVALTRAQSQVVTWWAPGTNAPNSSLHRVLFGRGVGEADVPATVGVPRDAEATAHLQDWAEAGALVLERADHDEAQAAPTAAAVPVLRIGTWTRRIDTDWRRTSYTALTAPMADGARGSVTGALTEGAHRAGAAGEVVGSEPETVLRDDEPDAPQQLPDTTPVLPGLESATPGAEVISPMALLPVGATFGSLVHAVLEHADPQAPDLRTELLRQIREQLIRWPVELDAHVLADALVAVCDTPLGPLADDVTLRSIGRRDRLCEVEFELPLGGGDLRHAGSGGSHSGGHAGGRHPGAGYGTHALLGDLAPLLRAHLTPGDPVRGWAEVLDASPEVAGQALRGYLTGSVDVVLRTGGRYLVVDYKTNWLGALDAGPAGAEPGPLSAADYRPQRLGEAMGHSSYPLQALLYAVVAHRFLRWRLAGYDPGKHLGGVLYLYVRGMCGPDTPVIGGQPCGVFSWKPPVALVTAVSDLLDGRMRREAS